VITVKHFTQLKNTVSRFENLTKKMQCMVL